MRILGLLLLLGGLGGASDAVRQGASPQAAVNSFNPDVTSGIVRPFSLASDDRSRPDSERDGDLTCFTMHTFPVVRWPAFDNRAGGACTIDLTRGIMRYNVRKVGESGKARRVDERKRGEKTGGESDSERLPHSHAYPVARTGPAPLIQRWRLSAPRRCFAQ